MFAAPALAALCVAPVWAQDEPPSEEEQAEEKKVWTIEASVSGATRSGNTESQEFGVDTKIQREINRTRHTAEFVFDYGESEVAAPADVGGTTTEETTNRLFFSYEHNRLLSDRLYVFGDIDYEVDQFSGYDYRGLLSAGVGYDVVKTDAVTWSVSGGPGYRWEREDVPGGEELTSAALRLASRYSNKVNDSVTLSNDTDITATEENTTYFNKAALTADLARGFAARFSVEVTYVTDPPPLTESTDTVSRAALVYSFGG